MQRTLLSTLALTTALLASAQLAPGTEAPLQQHMLEVNNEWRHMDPSPVNGDRLVRFSDDAERIAMHLHLVRATLIERTSEGLSAAQATERIALLEKLDAYADRGVFPRNRVLPFRNPVFIDPLGTACAVGQLMIESGHADLAQRIDAEMETAYVHDMHRADVDAWAVEHGFTEDELAWIQPGYLPDVPWTTLGGGTNGIVTTSLNLNDGRLLVAGAFTQAGGVTTTRVAVWDGSTFAPLGNGTVEGEVTCAIQYGGNIMLGGNFNVMNDIATWDGTSWAYSTAFMGKYSRVNALHMHEGELYAAGLMLGFAGPTHAVNKLDGAYWTPVGEAFDAEIFALASHDGKLVAAGAFTQPVGPTDPTILHVATFDQGWSQLGDGLDATVFDLLERNGALYAAGTLYENVAPRFGMARIASAADEWEPMMPELENYIYPWSTGPSEIRSMVDHGGSIVFGGTFISGQLMLMGQCIGRIGAPDAVELLGYFADGVRTVALYDDRIVAGGAFTEVNFAPVPYLASVSASVGMADHDNANALTVWPNPATNELFVSSTDAGTIQRIDAVDATGRLVMRSATNWTDRQAIDVSQLARGPYTLVLTDRNGTRRTAPFVKD